MPVGKPAFNPRVVLRARVDPETLLPSIVELKDAYRSLPSYDRSVVRGTITDEIEGFYFPAEEIAKISKLEDKKDKVNIHKRIKPVIESYVGIQRPKSFTIRLLPEPGSENITVWIFRVKPEDDVVPESRVADKPHPLAGVAGDGTT